MKIFIVAIISLSLIVSIFSCNGQQKSNEIDSKKFDFDQIYTLGLRGDMSSILELFDSVPEINLTAEQINLREKYYKRFREQGEVCDYETKDTLVIRIVELFHSYWKTVMLDSKAIGSADAELKSDLADMLCENSFVSTGVSKDSIADNLYVFLNGFFKSKGLYSNAMGKTGGFYDLFLWANESEKIFEMKLPETQTQVKVIFLENFVAKGWSDYATFGKYYAGGWATTDALYCVKEAYDISSEKFHVSYLTHEAQHFADYKLFPQLKQTDLEYRAKLAELSVAKETVYVVISKFILRAKNDSEYAHPFANYCVIRDLSKELFNQEFVSDISKWKKIPFQVINNASAILIKRHTSGLNNVGADSVTKFIE